MRYEILVGKKKFSVDVIEVGSGIARVAVNGEPYDVTIENYGEVSGSAVPGVVKPAAATAPAATAPAATAPASMGPAPAQAAPVREPEPASKAGPAVRSASGGTPLLAPMPGMIVKIKVAVGDAVDEDQTVVTMEAMKMENNIAAPAAGRVKEILVSPGAHVNTGDLILIIE